MEYEEFLDEIESLDFIPDAETADAALKAVMAILVSRLDEPEAQKLTEKLPRPLTFERLRRDQERQENLSVGEFIMDIAQQFRLSEDQAEALIKAVLRLIRDAVGDETILELEEALPSDWVATIEDV
jgi:uncharacterized protein (DUF2267 family)